MLNTSFNGRNPTLCPHGRNSIIVFHGPTSKSQLLGRIPTSQHHHCRTQLQLSAIEADNPTIWPKVNLQLQLSASMADKPTFCPSGLKSTPKCLFFKIFKFLGPTLPCETSFTHQTHSLLGFFNDNCDCHILCPRA